MNLYAAFKYTLNFHYKLKKRMKYDLETSPHHKISELIESKKTHIDILLLGDSVSERTSNTDTDTTPLFEMVGKKLNKNIDYFAITHSAYYTDIYLLYIALLKALNVKTDNIIIPINIRSFSPQWDLNPMFQCTGHIQQLLTALNKKGITNFNSYKSKPLTVSEFKKTSAEYPESRLNKIAQFENVISSSPKSEIDKTERKKAILTYHYMNRIERNHRKLSALADLAAFCQENTIKLLVYMVPINYEAGERYIGNQFTHNLKANVSIISDTLTSKSTGFNNKIIFKDFSTLLQSGSFFNQDETTEHLNQYGREILADQIISSGIQS